MEQQPVCVAALEYDNMRARAKLPKKRRRVIPVETLRPPPGPRSGAGGQSGGPPSGGPAGGQTQPRRANALKQNNPAKDILSTPKMAMKKAWNRAQDRQTGQNNA